MLVNELAYMQDGEEMNGLDLDYETERFIQRVIDEYSREYFSESTKAAAELVMQKRKQRRMDLFG